MPNLIEEKQKKSEAEIRQQMRKDVALLIANKVLLELREKIASGGTIATKDISDILRPIVDEKLDIDNSLFNKLVFENLDDLYNEVVPLIHRGIEKIREKKGGEKTAA